MHYGLVLLAEKKVHSSVRVHQSKIQTSFEYERKSNITACEASHWSGGNEKEVETSVSVKEVETSQTLVC